MQRTLEIVFRSNKLVRHGLTGFILALFMSTIIILVMDVRVQMGRLATASSDNVQWVLTQAETEVQTLRLAALHARTAETPNLDEIRLRFDVFYSRMQTLENSAVFAEMRNDPRVTDDLAEIRTFLQDWVPVIDSTDAALNARLPELLTASSRVQRITRDMSLAGIEFFSEMSDTRRASVARTLFNIAILTVALVASLLIVAFALLRLARARERDARENLQIRKRIETILSTSLDAVVVTNRDGKIEEYNGAAERVFGYSRAEAIGADMAELIIPDHFRKGHAEGMKRYIESGQRRVIDAGIVQLEAKRKDGTIFPVEISLSRANSPSGEIFIGFVRDISDRVLAETSLKDARDRAIAGEKKKAQLLAVMSHEMRTPLNGILGTLEVLDQDGLNAQTRRYLNIIKNSCQLLLGHVNDVLDISRLDAGKMSLHKTRFDLIKLLEDLVESQSITAARNGNSLILSPPNPVFHEVYSDPDRIRQILLNLISNAIKFTQNGTITLEVECQNGLKEVELRIIDTGVGISEADLERIFGDFVTVDSSYSRKAEGTGLGLGISQRLATALGGELGAESELGDGSLFWLRIPLDAPANAPRHQIPTEDTTADTVIVTAPMRVLVVEDNGVNRMVARKMLEGDGHSVTEAHDGAQGVERARTDTFDLILMDISMPGMDGITAARLIREAGATVPIVATTAHAMPDEIAAFRAAGMNDILIKPITRAALRNMLAGVHAPAPAADPARPAALPLFDQAHFDDMARDFSPQRLGTMLTTFNAEMSAFIDMPSGKTQEARRILAEEAHRMAGSAGVFGAIRLNGLLRDLQSAALNDATSDLSALRRKIAGCWQTTSRAMEQHGALFRDTD